MSVPNPPKNTRKSRPRDKLIPLMLMQEYDRRLILGVPNATAIRDLKISILASTSFTLLRFYRLSIKLETMDSDDAQTMCKTIHASLFPSWLDDDINTPANASYIGYFPYGYWELESE